MPISFEPPSEARRPDVGRPSRGCSLRTRARRSPGIRTCRASPAGSSSRPALSESSHRDTAVRVGPRGPASGTFVRSRQIPPPTLSDRRFGDYAAMWVVERLRSRLWYYFMARFVCASSVPIDLASVIWIIEFGRGFMATIDLGGIKIRFSRNYTCATPDGPLYVSWTLMIGLAMPSFRFFPMAWNLLALDNMSEGRMTVDFVRLGVSDDDGAASE